MLRFFFAGQKENLRLTVTWPDADNAESFSKESNMRRWLLSILFALLCGIGTTGATEVIRIGAYPFLPFVDNGTGLTYDLVKAMNAFQNDYQFQIVNTSPNRRYADMAGGAFSIMLFENIKWGWDAKEIDSSKVYLRGDGEVYVARSAPGRGQEYFSTLNDKHILGVLGYHYGFANYEADQTKLLQSFRMSFSANNALSLHHLLVGRGDVAVLTKSYLNRYLMKQPKDKSKLLVSDRTDQVYEHTAVVKKGSKPSAQDIDALLTAMEKAGVLKPLWANYGLEN